MAREDLQIVDIDRRDQATSREISDGNDERIDSEIRPPLGREKRP